MEKKERTTSSREKLNPIKDVYIQKWIVEKGDWDWNFNPNLRRPNFFLVYLFGTSKQYRCTGTKVKYINSYCNLHEFEFMCHLSSLYPCQSYIPIPWFLHHKAFQHHSPLFSILPAPLITILLHFILNTQYPKKCFILHTKILTSAFVVYPHWFVSIFFCFFLGTQNLDSRIAIVSVVNIAVG